MAFIFSLVAFHLNSHDVFFITAPVLIIPALIYSLIYSPRTWPVLRIIIAMNLFYLAVLLTQLVVECYFQAGSWQQLACLVAYIVVLYSTATLAVLDQLMMKVPVVAAAVERVQCYAKKVAARFQRSRV